MAIYTYVTLTYDKECKYKTKSKQKRKKLSWPAKLFQKKTYNSSHLF